MKKSLFVIILSIVVIAIATGCIVLYNGLTFGWDKLAEVFTSNYAIFIYVMIGVLLIVLVNLLIIKKRREEIK